MAHRFEPLTRQHNRADFRCGSPPFDSYLQQLARKDIERHIAAVFVLVEEAAPTKIIGYYTLSAFVVEVTDLPEQMQRKLPRYPCLPATLLGRLARDTRYPGTGSFLLMDALARALKHSEQITSLAVIAEAKDAAALKFYERFGFTPLGSHAKRVFLPMGTIEQLAH